MMTNANIKTLCQFITGSFDHSEILVPENHLCIINPGSHS